VSSHEPPTQRTTKRIIVAAGAAFGIKPADAKSVPALMRLNGTFERTGSALAILVSGFVWFAGVLLILGGDGI
jgi:hypothetical protein